MTSLSLKEMIAHPEETISRAQRAPVLLESDGAPLVVMLSATEYQAMQDEHRQMLERYVAAFESEIEAGFEGPFQELTPELSEEIRRLSHGDLEHGSLAVPPGWRPRVSA